MFFLVFVNVIRLIWWVGLLGFAILKKQNKTKHSVSVRIPVSPLLFFFYPALLPRGPCLTLSLWLCGCGLYGCGWLMNGPETHPLNHHPTLYIYPAHFTTSFSYHVLCGRLFFCSPWFYFFKLCLLSFVSKISKKKKNQQPVLLDLTRHLMWFQWTTKLPDLHIWHWSNFKGILPPVTNQCWFSTKLGVSSKKCVCSFFNLPWSKKKISDDIKCQTLGHQEENQRFLLKQLRITRCFFFLKSHQ